MVIFHYINLPEGTFDDSLFMKSKTQEVMLAELARVSILKADGDHPCHAHHLNDAGGNYVFFIMPS